jgi:hypothetical protein
MKTRPKNGGSANATQCVIVDSVVFDARWP